MFEHFSTLCIMPFVHYPSIKLVFKTKNKSIGAMSNICLMLIMTLYSTLSDVVYGVCIINFEQISQAKSKFVNVVSFLSKKTTKVLNLPGISFATVVLITSSLLSSCANFPVTKKFKQN